MKTTKILSLFIFALFIVSCSSTKKTTNDSLFNTTWELEYISGIRIAFTGLYPDKKPIITFNKTSNKVEGNNSCNGYSADYTLNGNEISFGEPGPTTMMYCGQGEKVFLNTIKKVNKYKIDSNGKLNLMIGDVPVMRFKKVTKQNDLLKKRSQNTVNVENNESLKIEQITKGVYFKASGTEPFWGLEISENFVKLTTIGDSLITPHTAPIRAMDANVKLYKIQTESSKMTIQIAQSECTNAMSGKVSPYTVSIDYKKNLDKKLITLQGCGHYITDYRLNDIWVLEKLNGVKITKEAFSKEFPTMEINSATNTFSGFAGCNRMNGNLFYEKGHLSFTNISSTKMMCEPSNKEPEFLKALRSGTTYKIENNRLTLSNSDGELLIFKKID